MNLENSRALAQFGITLKESERYNNVSSLFGNRLAEKELSANLKSYEREFLMDEAVSLPHTYRHFDGDFYSQNSRHDLFNVKKQIDARERNGATLEGFTRFENLVAQAPLDTVSVWYSPDGPSGFEGVNFDSGRLYFNFKTAPDASVNFDMKVRPEFPVLPLLGTVAEAAGQTRPRFDSPETGKMHYLTRPMATGMKTEDFFAFLKDYAAREASPLYVSRRNSHEPAYRTLASAVAEMEELLSRDAAHEPFVYDAPGDRTAGALMHEEDLMQRYLAVIAPYVEQNDGTFTLYGCSTTSTVSRSDIQGVLASHSVDGLVALHSTQRRLLTDTSKLPGVEDKKTSFPCPNCGGSIPSGEGRTQCPHCGITKEQYAQKTGAQTCA